MIYLFSWTSVHNIDQSHFFLQKIGSDKMNFQFSLNETFPGTHSILKIGHDLLPEDYNTFNGRNFHQIQQRVNDILDKMGQASSNAQGTNCF